MDNKLRLRQLLEELRTIKEFKNIALGPTVHNWFTIALQDRLGELNDINRGVINYVNAELHMRYVNLIKRKITLLNGNIDYLAKEIKLNCASMVGDKCEREVSYIDNKGYIYCQSCGITRGGRKLTKLEILTIKSSMPIKGY